MAFSVVVALPIIPLAVRRHNIGMNDHARNVYIAIVLISFVLLVAALADQSELLRASLSDARSIREMQVRHGDILRALRLATAQALRDCCGAAPSRQRPLHHGQWIANTRWRSGSPYAYCLNVDTFVRSQPPSGQIADHSVPILRFSGSDIDVPPIASVGDFETLWDDLRVASSPLVLLDAAPAEMIATRWKPDNPDVTERGHVSAKRLERNEYCIDVGLKLKSLEENLAVFEGDTSGGFANYYEYIAGFRMKLTVKLRTAGIHIPYNQVVAHALRRDWSPEGFSDAFPALSDRAARLKSLNPAELVTVLHDEDLRGADRIELGGARIPARAIHGAGVAILIAAQAYWLACARIAAREKKQERTAVWLGFADDKFARVVGMVSGCAFPTSVVMVLLIRWTDGSLILKCVAAVASVSFGVMTAIVALSTTGWLSKKAR